MDGARPTLIYDGECGFCTTAAHWVARHWTGPDVPEAIPWQRLPEDRGVELELSGHDFARSAWWADGARVEGGYRAVAYALRATHGPWALAGRVLLVPPVSWAAAPGYRLVARYRHRLPGGTPACRAL